MALVDLITTVTDTEYWTRLRARYDADEVAWRSWSPRNAFLTASRFLTFAAAELRSTISEALRAQFLQFMAEGLVPGTVTPALTYFARSQFSLDRQPAVFARGRVVLTVALGAPPVPLAPGAAQVGTPGPLTMNSRLFVSLDAATLSPGKNVVEFQAAGTGDLYNLPNNAAIELKTSLVGVTASIPATGPATAIGAGAAGLTMYAAQSGVTIEIIDPGATNQPLSITGNIGTKRLEVSLPTDGGGALYMTAQELSAEFKAIIANGGFAVDPLLVDCVISGAGTGIVQPTATPVALDWTGSWLSIYGKTIEDDLSLIRRCELRLDTRGGGAGDGAPASDASTDFALEYWARAVPAGREASPVTRCRVYSNMDPGGLLEGAAATVVIGGPAGALPGADVTAVGTNFEKPQKYSFGTTLYLVSVINKIVAPNGTIYVRRASGRTLAEVQTAVEAALTAYQQDEAQNPIGGTTYPTNLAAVMRSGDPAAIRNVDLPFPAGPVTCTAVEVAVIDVAGLSYVYV